MENKGPVTPPDAIIEMAVNGFTTGAALKTFNHERAVAELSVRIGQQMELRRSRTGGFKPGALLHDIWKIGHIQTMF